MRVRQRFGYRQANPIDQNDDGLEHHPTLQRKRCEASHANRRHLEKANIFQPTEKG